MYHLANYARSLTKRVLKPVAPKKLWGKNIYKMLSIRWYIGLNERSISLPKKDEQLQHTKQVKRLLISCSEATYNAADMQQAIKLAQEIVLDGKRFEDLSTPRQNEVKDQAEALVAGYQQEMHLLLTGHKDALEALVKKLETEITISGSDAQTI